MSLLEENMDRGEELPPFLPFFRPAQDALAPVRLDFSKTCDNIIIC
ncbi:hypothetical protein GCWU000341_02404 [Oribacterium sp. oral taxon 078 str. F0262]|nr:hypothetical protein GCWU000341_02404 [Oribacterium sp. oral taxon 078 str. F0262]